jgi:hypothetical protein
MPPAEIAVWESKNGFTSLQSLLNKAVKEETLYFEKLESIGEDKLSKLEVKPHCDFVLQNSKYFKFHEEGWFELKVSNENLAPILNLDGIVFIGNEARKYTESHVYVTTKEKVDLLRLIDENIIEINGVESYAIKTSRREHDLARLVKGSFSVNSCTGTAGRYRVRLYEDVITYFIGPTGTFALDHGFKVKSFKKTIWGWDRNFDTGALAAQVTYQADWGSGSQSIRAAFAVNEIGWPFVTNYQYIDYNPPAIYYSRGQGWGRDGCTCTYQGYY